ncbi:MAG: HNH endonuclease [Flavobacteriales bacterium]|jgi:5-methylcytosine-specific restriction protein A|nr:HNH endonuclease [Flavobacteriales bacterium]
MKNPKWQKDEIILALDLYFDLEPGQIHSRNPKIIELSEVLNKLPIHENIPDKNKFRNSNGVGLKLSNFLAIDPNYEGKGMQSYSKLDKSVFDEYHNNQAELKKTANQIKETIKNSSLNIKLYKIDEDLNEEIKVQEGKVIYKLHKHIERDYKINKKKKHKYFKENGKLDCEVCGFDFYKTYGELGKGYIECHHRIPLSELQGESTTSLKDLALVCSNCHRMLHREINTLTINELKKRINNSSYQRV